MLFYLRLLVLLAAPKGIESLDCYTCTDIGISDNCSSIAQCSNGQSCFTASETVGERTNLTLGCTANCGYIPVYPGRVKRHGTEGPSETCYECCSSDACNNILCGHVNHHDGWADWSDWGTCSVSCDTGLQTRSRICSSRYSSHCFGDSTEYRMCKPEPCASQGTTSTIAFHAHTLRNTLLDNGVTLIFGNNLVNEGGAYNSSSGVFTAPRNGTYAFSAHVCLTSGNAMSFSIMVGTTAYAATYGRGYKGCECSSIQAIAVLQKDDKVSVQWKTYRYTGSSVICQSIPMSSFSGLFNN